MSGHEYRIGSTIVYSPFGGGEREIIVTSKEADIKNGRPGFDGYQTNEKDFTVWGYDYQIVRVVKF